VLTSGAGLAVGEEREEVESWAAERKRAERSRPAAW
jgi:hypothetical protein